jgi:hypothetical protein
MLAQFDAADTDDTCPVRFESAVPTQALAMLNSEFMNEQAKVLAERLKKEAGDDVTAWWRLGDAYIERRKVYWTVQAIFAFMIVNATVVFGPPFWKWVALTVTTGLLLMRIVCQRPRVGH